MNIKALLIAYGIALAAFGLLMPFSTSSPRRSPKDEIIDEVREVRDQVSEYRRELQEARA